MAKEINAADNDLLWSSVDGENYLIQKIQKTHALGFDEYNVKPLVAIVEHIMIRAPPSSATIITHLGAPSHDDGTDKDVAQIAKVLESPINYTSYVMTWKCVGWVDSSHAATMQLLKSLSNYSWDAKAVITYAAFAINYGEFSMLTHESSSDKTIATLMGLPDDDAFESYHSEDVQLLLLTAIRLTRCIAIDFKDIHPKYIELHLKPHEIPLAVYLIIRTLVVCASLLKDILCDHKKVTDKGNEILSKLQDRLYSVMNKFEERVKEFRKLDEIELRYIEFQENMSRSHLDNIKVLSTFFRHGEEANQMPLYDGSRNTNDSLEVLRLKHVLLLISDLNLPPEELHILHFIHNERAVRHDYEILWLPIINDPHAQGNDARFINLRNRMPWFSAYHPSAIEPAAIRYIQEKLQFVHMPILIVLDTHGKLYHHNVIPMMWIWAAAAFPFTQDRERKLWDINNQWNINLIVDSIDPRIPEWINTNRVICLYGGDDITWVRKFTLSAKRAARALNVQLEMLYVGKRNPKERVRLCHDVIAMENLSHIFSTDYYDFVWYFWVRLASMWNSKTQMGRTVEDDHIMKGILDLLTYDNSDLGWATFSRGTHETITARGNELVPVLENYTTWEHEVDHPDKFVPVLDKNLREHQPEHECKRMILPGQAGVIPDRVVCMECGKTMDKYVLYRLCTD